MLEWLLLLLLLLLAQSYLMESFSNPARFEIGSFQTDISPSDPRVLDIINRDNGAVYIELTDTTMNLELGRAVNASAPSDVAQVTTSVSYAEAEAAVRPVIAYVDSASRLIHIMLVGVMSKGLTPSGCYVIQAQVLEVRLNVVRVVTFGIYKSNGKVFMCQLQTNEDQPTTSVPGFDVAALL